jgi:HPt (histidine-containing phosphotransfer) domain-containing protein
MVASSAMRERMLAMLTAGPRRAHAGRPRPDRQSAAPIPQPGRPLRRGVRHHQWRMNADPLDSTVLDALAEELADPAAFARLLRRYLDDLPDRVEEVVNAADAEDLTAAADALKAASGTFGAAEVARISAELAGIGETGADAPPPLLDALLSAAEAARVALEQRVEAIELDD